MNEGPPDCQPPPPPHTHTPPEPQSGATFPVCSKQSIILNSDESVSK